MLELLRGGWPDLAGEETPRSVEALTRLLVGGEDDRVIDLKQMAFGSPAARRTWSSCPGRLTCSRCRARWKKSRAWLPPGLPGSLRCRHQGLGLVLELEPSALTMPKMPS
jgi:hypothetical protein